MLTFIVVTIILLSLLIVGVLALTFGGAMFLLLFGDLIVCIFIIRWIIKGVRRKR